MRGLRRKTERFGETCKYCMDPKEFKQRLKKLPKQSHYRSITKRYDADGELVWVEGHAVTNEPKQKRGPKPGNPHANKGKKRDPAIGEKIRQTNLAKSARRSKN